MAECLALDIKEMHDLKTVNDPVPEDLSKDIDTQIQELSAMESDTYKWYYWQEADGQWGCDLAATPTVRQWQKSGKTTVPLIDEKMWASIKPKVAE
jgi:hypothetical protein